MALESFQEFLYIITLIFSAATAIVGYRAVHLLWKQKDKLQLSKTTLAVFTFLAVGYILFALGELSWYLIYGFVQKLPLASVPDMYWILGTIALLIGFTLFSLSMYKEHGGVGHGLLSIFIAGAVVAGLLYFVLSKGIIKPEESGFAVFLGFYYPIISALIVLASLNVYLFFEKVHNSLAPSLLLFMIANGAIFIGDLLFTYYSSQEVYGFIGIVSDLFYICAYAFLVVAFWMVGKKVNVVSVG